MRRNGWTTTVAGWLFLVAAAPAWAQASPAERLAAERARRAAILEARVAALGVELEGRQGLALTRLERELARVGSELVRVDAMTRMERAELLRHELIRARRARVAPAPARAPEPWLTQDPADSLYRAARQALNREEYRRAADVFAEIRSTYPRSGYVEAAHYFQALALQRAGGTDRLQQGLEVLNAMLERHPDAEYGGEARQLRLRIQAELARRGDAASAVEVADQAVQSCEDEDADIRAAALSALLRMDAERATPVLKEILRDRDRCSSELREQAVVILARSAPSDPETVALLLDLAHGNPDPDPEVREAAVIWLSRAPTDRALDALASILESPDAEVAIQEAALYAVSRHEGARAADILRGYAERSDAPPELREAAVVAIGRSDRFGGGAYLRDLYARVDDSELRESILASVARSEDEESGPWLLERARDTSEDVDVRRNALYWAAQRDVLGPAELRAMYASLDDVEMKEQVVGLLGRDGGTEAVDALMQIAEGEEDPELRERAVYWLGRTDDPRVPDFLLRLIRGGGRA